MMKKTDWLCVFEGRIPVYIMIRLHLHKILISYMTELWRILGGNDADDFLEGIKASIYSLLHG
jgi:hypothetical protein